MLHKKWEYVHNKRTHYEKIYSENTNAEVKHYSTCWWQSTTRGQQQWNHQIISNWSSNSKANHIKFHRNFTGLLLQPSNLRKNKVSQMISHAKQVLVSLFQELTKEFTDFQQKMQIHCLGWKCKFTVSTENAMSWSKWKLKL